MSKLARGCAVAGLVLVLTGCTSSGKPAAAPAHPNAVKSSAPPCDGSQITDRYAEFAYAFNLREFALAVDQFGGHHGFAWWDPSDPSGGVQQLSEIHDHFVAMYVLGVRLPATATFTPGDYYGPDADGQDRPAGATGFTWDDQHGFWGKGGIDCATGKIAYMVIDGWSRAIAGRAPPGPSG